MRAAEAEAVVAALRRPRYEVLPLDGIADSVAEHLPDDVTITVSASPSKGMASTLSVAESLAGQGRHVVPHVAARLISDEVHLKDVAQRLADHGIREAFVIAGDVKEPAGRFQGALDLLTAMAEADCRPERVGIAGYPQSHPFIDDDVTIQSMWDKRRFASYIVSQICFRPKVVAGWVRRVRRRGVDLPVHVGVPGALDPARLVRIPRASASKPLSGSPGTTPPGCPTSSASAATIPASWSKGSPRASPTRTTASPVSTSTPSTSSPEPNDGASKLSPGW